MNIQQSAAMIAAKESAPSLFEGWVPCTAASTSAVRLYGQGEPVECDALCGMSEGDAVYAIVNDGKVLVIGNATKPANGNVFMHQFGEAKVLANLATYLEAGQDHVAMVYDDIDGSWSWPPAVNKVQVDGYGIHASVMDEDGEHAVELNGNGFTFDGAKIATVADLTAWAEIASTPATAHNIAITDRSRYRAADKLVDLNIWVSSLKTTSALSAGQPFQICTLPEGYRPRNAVTLAASIASTGTLAHVFSAYTGASGAVYLRDHTALNSGATVNNVVICGQFFKE